MSLTSGRQSLGYTRGDEPVRGTGYRLVEYLGDGQFGEVWKAEAPGGFEVALKIMDLTREEGRKEYEAIQRFKKVSNPHLTRLHACWLVDGRGNEVDTNGPALPVDQETIDQAFADARDWGPTRLVVAMDLGEKCLHKRLRECIQHGLSGIPPEELMGYMWDAAKGIDYLHRPIHDVGEGPRSIVHRDIKPRNILVVGEGAQICDFGLARAVAGLHDTSNRSRTATLSGTIAYMAPELFDAMRATPRSDQYALGITYVELRTGRVPYDSGEQLNALSVMKQALMGTHNLSALEPEEQRVLEKALSTDPANRYDSCCDLVAAIQQATEGLVRQDKHERELKNGIEASLIQQLDAELAGGRIDEIEAELRRGVKESVKRELENNLDVDPRKRIERSLESQLEKALRNRLESELIARFTREVHRNLESATPLLDQETKGRIAKEVIETLNRKLTETVENREVEIACGLVKELNATYEAERIRLQEARHRQAVKEELERELEATVAAEVGEKFAKALCRACVPALKTGLTGELTAKIDQNLRKSLRGSLEGELRTELLQKLDELEARLESQLTAITGRKLKNQFANGFDGIEVADLKSLKESFCRAVRNEADRRINSGARPELKRALETALEVVLSQELEAQKDLCQRELTAAPERHWQPACEQELSRRLESLRTRLVREVKKKIAWKLKRQHDEKAKTKLAAELSRVLDRTMKGPLIGDLRERIHKDLRRTFQAELNKGLEREVGDQFKNELKTDVQRELEGFLEQELDGRVKEDIVQNLERFLDDAFEKLKKQLDAEAELHKKELEKEQEAEPKVVPPSEILPAPPLPPPLPPEPPPQAVSQTGSLLEPFFDDQTESIDEAHASADWRLPVTPIWRRCLHWAVAAMFLVGAFHSRQIPPPDRLLKDPFDEVRRLIDEGRYEDAVKSLRLNGGNSGKAARLDREIDSKWFKKIRTDWSGADLDGDWKSIHDECCTMLEWYPRHVELALLRARTSLATEEYSRAASELAAFDPASLTEEPSTLWGILDFMTKSNLPNFRSMTSAKLRELAAQRERIDLVIADPFWSLENWERQRFDLATTEVTLALVRCLIHDEDFRQAADTLNTRPVAKSPQRSVLGEELQRTWLSSLQSRWDQLATQGREDRAPSIDELHSECASLVKFFPDYADAHLLKARCLALDRDDTVLNQSARDALEQLRQLRGTNVPPEQEPLTIVIELLAEHGAAPASENQLDDSQRKQIHLALAAYKSPIEDETEGGFWEPHRFEQKFVEDWAELVKPDPLAKISEYVEQGEWENADDLLQALSNQEIDESQQAYRTLLLVTKGRLMLGEDSSIDTTELKQVKKLHDDFLKAVPEQVRQDARFPAHRQFNSLMADLSKALVDLARKSLPFRVPTEDDQVGSDSNTAIHALSMAESLEPEAAIEAEVLFLQRLIVLHNPKSESTLVEKSISELKQSLKDWDLSYSEYEQRVEEVACALGTLTVKPEPHLDELRAAIDLLREAAGNREVWRYSDAIVPQMKELWEKRIHLLLLEAQLPVEKEWPDIESDRTWLTRSQIDSGLIDTWRAENLLLFEKDASEAYKLVPRTSFATSDAESYRCYILALALSKVDKPEWDEVVTALHAVFRSVDGKEVSCCPERLAQAARVAVRAAENLRRSVTSPLDPCFGERAAKVEQLLAMALSHVPNEDRNRLLVNQAIAAYESGAYEEACRVAKTVFNDVGGEHPDRMAFLAACTGSFSAHYDAQEQLPIDDLAVAVQASHQLLDALESSRKLRTCENAEVEAIYERFLERTIELGQTNLSDLRDSGVPPRVLTELLGKMAVLAWIRDDVDWPFGWKQTEVAEYVAVLLTNALAAADDAVPKADLADYYALRGAARCHLQLPNLDDARQDGDEAIKLKHDSAIAKGVLCHVLYKQALQQTQKSAFIGMLKESITNGEDSIAASPQENPIYNRTLPNLISAYVYLANYTPVVDEQRTLLEKMLGLSKKAKEDLPPWSNHPYLAEGNALEDLAWIARVDSRQNYLGAIRAFEKARNARILEGQALCSIGRCYFRAIADTELSPSDLNPNWQTEEDVLEAAQTYAEEATKVDPDRASTWRQLAFIVEYRGQVDQADSYFTKAKELANAAGANDRILYILDWVWSAFDSGREEETLRRIEELEEAPPYLNLDGKKQAALIRADMAFDRWHDSGHETAYLEGVSLLKDQLDGGVGQANWTHQPLLSEFVRRRIEWHKNGSTYDANELTTLIQYADTASVLAWRRKDAQEALKTSLYLRGLALKRARNARVPPEEIDQHLSHAIDMHETLLTRIVAADQYDYRKYRYDLAWLLYKRAENAKENHTRVPIPLQTIREFRTTALRRCDEALEKAPSRELRQQALEAKQDFEARFEDLEKAVR